MGDRNRIPAGVWALGFVSMLMDISSEMIHSLLPLYLTVGLGASALTVGIIEGIAESTALIVKVFSGALSDRWRKRKSITAFGYGLAALSKPLFALATGPWLVFTARFLDRIGKGIRGAPRDALIADLTPKELRGAAFGLRQSLDTVGAFAGPLLAMALMLAWDDNFRAVFWVAVIPAILSFALILFAVREPPAVGSGKADKVKLERATLKKLGVAFWAVTAAGAALTLARFSEAFLILRAQDLGLAVALAPLVLVGMQRSARALCLALGIQRLRDRERIRVQFDDGIELRPRLVDGLDAGEVERRDLLRGHAPAGHRLLQVCDGRLDHVERRRGFRPRGVIGHALGTIGPAHGDGH